MGLYKALVDSRRRFKAELPPLGFAEKPFHWDIEFPPGPDGRLHVSGPFREPNARTAELPDRQRSGKRTSEDNIKPYLVADQPAYIFSEGIESLEQQGFLKLHEELLISCIASTYEDKDELIRALSACVEFLRQPSAQQKCLLSIPHKEKDLIRFVSKSRAFSDYPVVREFWARRLGEDQSSGDDICGVCGSDDKPAKLLKTMPVPLRLFDYMPALTSFTPSSFDSFGKEQMDNSPICIDCGMAAIAVLSFLIRRNGHSGRHAVVLAEESRRSGTARPLANQLAVFWTREPVTLQSRDKTTTAEGFIQGNLDDEDGDIATPLLPSANPTHLKALLESPWYCRGIEVSNVNTTEFYFAIFSPNKSRLVIREWIETTIDSVRKTLLSYRQSLSIINPQTGSLVVPPLRAILQSLRNPSSQRSKHKEEPRLAEIEPELLRQLIRCMYQGAKPPEALLTRALQAFRSPSISADEGNAFARLCGRRATLAASIKLVLTYPDPIDMKAMEQLETPLDADCVYKRQSSYLCGRLLALLNNIQYRASMSRRGPNTTLVDKFYAAASTAPHSVFGSLLKMANAAHLPKIRKDPSRNYPIKTSGGATYVGDLLNDLVNSIDNATEPGLPSQLTPRQQAEFALGYHHQQAILNPPYQSKTLVPPPPTQTQNG